MRGRVVRRQAGQLDGEFGGGNLADGDGLAVQVFSVAGNVFDGVADGVAKIEDGAKAGFGFILADDLAP